LRWTGPPDGSHLALANADFATDHGTTISVVAPDGSGRFELTVPAPWELLPLVLAWSPDGTHVAVAAQDTVTANGDMAIAIVPVDGSAPVIVDVPTAVPDGYDDFYMHPEWSPDGTTLAFAHGGVPGTAVWSVHTDGTGLTAVADYTGSPTYLHVGGPTWLSDTRLAVGTRTMANPCCTGETGSVWGIDSDGTDPAPILADAGLYNFPDMGFGPGPNGGYPEPRMSPDRTRMAFRGGGARLLGEEEPSKTGLWTMNADGSGLREIAPLDQYDPSTEECFDWSPDSQFVVWEDRNGSGSADTGLMIRRADGSAPATRIPTAPWAAACPKWASVPSPPTQDHVTIHVTGKYSYDVSSDLSGGNLEVALASDGKVATVGGAGTYPGRNGGTATISIDARRFWILPIYTGTVAISDPTAGLSLSYPLFFPPMQRTATGATWASSWLDFSHWPWGAYTAAITVDDIT